MMKSLADSVVERNNLQIVLIDDWMDWFVSFIYLLLEAN